MNRKPKWLLTIAIMPIGRHRDEIGYADTRNVLTPDPPAVWLTARREREAAELEQLRADSRDRRGDGPEIRRAVITFAHKLTADERNHLDEREAVQS